MRKDFGAKTWLYPMPVLIIGTYDEKGVANAMNAAWGGISETNQISICVDDAHKTTENFLKTGAFTVSVATADTLAECDYFGIATGNKVENKVEKAGFHTTKSTFVNAPIIDELPMTLECKVISYTKETCILIGEIVNVSVDESVLTNGKVDPKKLKPLVFDTVNHTYMVATEAVGPAFSAGKKFLG